MFVSEHGSRQGESIVFLHGNAVGGWMWQPCLADLAGYHCILVDLPGHGKSNDQEWVSLADTARRVSEIIRGYTKGGKAHIVGASLGGSVAFQLLCDHPELVDRALISGTSLLPMPGGSFFKFMIRLIAPVMKKDFVMRAALKALNFSEEGFEQFRQAILAVSSRTFVKAFDDGLNQRYSKDLEKAKNPVLLISGEKEPGYIAKSNTMVAMRHPNAVARIVPGMGHGWMGESPQLFNRVLKAWLADGELPSELVASIKK
ncbi:MAG: alpha/beta hydrolase [Anaerolineales bacterium]|nr:alpha/beta hydrolase [Anaerolineales bacterium]